MIVNVAISCRFHFPCLIIFSMVVKGAGVLASGHLRLSSPTLDAAKRTALSLSALLCAVSPYFQPWTTRFVRSVKFYLSQLPGCLFWYGRTCANGFGLVLHIFPLSMHTVKHNFYSWEIFGWLDILTFFRSFTHSKIKPSSWPSPSICPISWAMLREKLMFRS